MPPLILAYAVLTSGTGKAAVGPKRKPGEDASIFKTDKSGRMLIAESDDSNSDNDRKVEGSAFVSAQRGVDGQTRGAGGTVRFSKNTKRAREEEAGMDIDDVDDRPRSAGGVKTKVKAEAAKDRRQKKMKARLGEEFRAKVRRCLFRRLVSMLTCRSVVQVISNGPEDRIRIRTCHSARPISRREEGG